MALAHTEFAPMNNQRQQTGGANGNFSAVTVQPVMAVHAEPITVFNVEVFSVQDPVVAKKTTILMRIVMVLALVALASFIIEIIFGDPAGYLSAVTNLIVALALPFCGLMGVRDRNLQCLQYFCCCSYLCASVTFIALIQIIVFLSHGKSRYIYLLILNTFILYIYLRGGNLAQQLQHEPYFTEERLAPRRSISVSQSFSHPQPVVDAAPTVTARPIPVQSQAMGTGLDYPPGVVITESDAAQQASFASLPSAIGTEVPGARGSQAVAHPLSTRHRTGPGL